MIRSQRRRHLIVWLILGPMILAGFAAGLAARRPAPVENAKPGADLGITTEPLP